MSLDERQRAGIAAPPSRLPLVLVAVVVIAAIGGITWFLLGRQAPAPAGNSANMAAAANMAMTADPLPGRDAVLPSGVRMEVIREGNGPQLARADAILVRYETRRVNGPVLDGNMETPQGAGLTLNQVGGGFADALSRMRPGGIARIRLTARLFYGDRLPANGPFRPDDELDVLIRIEQVVVGRGPELEANGGLAGNTTEGNLAAPAPPPTGR
jgi:hypothetical protein